MKGIKILLLLLAASAPPGVSARGVATVIDSLSASRSYHGNMAFTVAMPQLPEDVTYNVEMFTVPSPDTVLFPCSYLIDWTIESAAGPSNGFSSFFNGNHYRFAGEKLQEYHASSDSVPFLPRRFGASSSDGVQYSAQFVSLLPVSIASGLKKMLADSTFTVSFIPDTIVAGEKATVIKAIQTLGGHTAVESEYIFDPRSYAPRKAHFENSPGSVSEQTVDVTYFPAAALPKGFTISEPELISRYPDIFARLRQSSFALENLVGHPLPGFSAPTPTAERYSRRTGDPLPSPTVLAIIDPTASFAAALVEELRSAAASSPFPLSLILAFASTNSDRIEEITGPLRAGEVILQSARGLARDFGAASLPSILIVDSSSKVTDVIVGYNNDIATSVIQKIALQQ